MAGLSPIKRTIASGQIQEIIVRGSLIFLRRVRNGPPEDLTSSDMPLAIKVTAEVQDTGEKYTVEMAAAEKLSTASQYWRLEIENTTDFDLWVELYVGVGDFFRPVPDIVNVSVTGAGKKIVAYSDNVNIDGGASVTLLNENLSRTKAVITALATNTATIRLGNADVAADNGIPLAPGETIGIETTTAIEAISEGADNQAAAIQEWTS